MSATTSQVVPCVNKLHCSSAVLRNKPKHLRVSSSKVQNATIGFVLNTQQTCAYSKSAIETLG